MPIITVTGRNARAFWTKIDASQLFSYSGGNNFLLAANELIPNGITKHPVSGSQGWANFPFLSSISFNVEGGTQLVQVLGLDNPVSIEEVGLALQDVNIECLFQPTTEGKKLFDMFKRVEDANDPLIGHWGLWGVRVYISGMTYYQGGQLQKGLVHIADCWSCLPRTITFNQPEGGAATLRVNLGAPFIRVASSTDTPPAAGYNTSVAILNAFEGRIVIYDEGGNNALDVDFPLLVTSLNFDIRNNVQTAHTFLRGAFNAAKFMNAVRAVRAIGFGVQTVEGSFTLFAPRDVAGQINLNRIPKYGKIEISYYPYAGSDASINTVPTTPQITFRFYNVKFIRTAYNITPDRAMTLTMNFQATSSTGYAWEVE